MSVSNPGCSGETTNLSQQKLTSFLVCGVLNRFLGRRLFRFEGSHLHDFGQRPSERNFLQTEFKGVSADFASGDHPAGVGGST